MESGFEKAYYKIIYIYNRYKLKKREISILDRKIF